MSETTEGWKPQINGERGTGGRHPMKQNLPMSTAEVREMTLIAAGFDPEEIGKIVRRATDKLLQKLEAKKKQYFTHEGLVTDERTDEDNQSQIKAASELASIGIDVMALRRRAGSETPAPSAVNIDISGWTVQPTPPAVTEPKDVTP